MSSKIPPDQSTYTVNLNGKSYKLLRFQPKGRDGLVGLGLGALTYYVLPFLADHKLIDPVFVVWGQTAAVIFVAIVMFVLLPILTWSMIVQIGEDRGLSSKFQALIFVLSRTALYIFLPALAVSVPFIVIAILSI